MSGITLIEYGDNVPVDLLLSDGATDQYPQAEVYDPDGNNLTTISLSHAGDGLYQPASAYTMPAEDYISVVFIVYTDSGHTVLSAIYQRDIAVFRTIDVDDYKATGFAVPDEYDAVLTAIQADLDNPTQYMADVSALSTEVNATANRTAIIAEVDANEAKIDTIITNIGNLNDLAIVDVQTAMTNQGYTAVRAALLDNLSNLDMAISALNDLSQVGVQTAMTAQGYTIARGALLDNLNATITSVLAAIAVAQTDLDNPDQYKATGFAVTGEYTAALVAIQADLDDPDQYKATGFATAGEYDVALASIQADTDSIQLSELSILEDLADIKGTGFVKDVNSLTNMPLVGTIVDGVWNALLDSYSIAGSAAVRLQKLFWTLWNKKVLTKVNDNLYTEELYDEAGVAIVRTRSLTKVGDVETRE